MNPATRKAIAEMSDLPDDLSQVPSDGEDPAHTHPQPNLTEPAPLDSAAYLPQPEERIYRMEVPTSPEPYFLKAPLPTPLSPMGTIEAEGEMYRGLGNPRTPLWVTLTSWPILGLPALVTLGVTLSEAVERVQTAQSDGIKSKEDLGMVMIPTAALLLATFLSATLLVILLKGTLAKFRAR